MGKTIKKLLGLVVLVLVGWQLLAASQAVAQGVHQALAVCGNLLIPSLFPFMTLAALLPATEAGRIAVRPLRVVARRLYRLPSAAAPALLMSWIGGYPAGAYTIAELTDRGELTPAQAGRALCCCVNSGPAFMVTVVGAGIFGSAQLGLWLFACQLVASLLVALLPWARTNRAEVTRPVPANKPFAEALVASVASATAGMVSVCAFVLLMGAVTAMLQQNGGLDLAARLLCTLSGGWLSPDAAGTLAAGMLEICTGCTLGGALVPLEALSVLPFLLSFGGLSVICQVMAAVGGRGIPLGQFLLSRPLHGVITALLAYPLLNGKCAAITTGLIASPVLHHDSRTVPAVVLMLATAAFLCLVVEDGKDKVL